MQPPDTFWDKRSKNYDKRYKKKNYLFYIYSIKIAGLKGRACLAFPFGS